MHFAKLGVGCGIFHPGVNGLIGFKPPITFLFSFHLLYVLNATLHLIHLILTKKPALITVSWVTFLLSL